VAHPRSIVIHGHFYQPPREHPWLEEVEVQDSAAPWHDWNERVTAECYSPNTAARRVTDDNRILDIVDNFEKISFNVGPTLMAWLERRAPDVYAKILEADRVSARARGHGNAIAQVYNHMIMPLATRRDKVTQVRWGIADFRARFGREPQGMWLPETAVDEETLEVVAEAGIAFTILAPHQAWRIRPLGTEAWTDVNEGVDPSRPYRWRGRRGSSITLFFYDGPISRAIAFGNALERSEHLVAQLRGGFSDARSWPEIVHCATDGESYGHHRHFADMALAATVQQIEREDGAELTNYAAFLAKHPPDCEAQIHAPTSWSCTHGVERWRADCGCRTDPSKHQRWRRPLREALDWLRDHLDLFYEARASEIFKDPWGARDDYIEVILDRTRLTGFLERHERTPLDPAAKEEARRLLEMQRNRLLMYTSCGWFFDELSALEPVQILKYAAMAMQYLRDLGGGNAETEFVRRLGAAPTNVPELRDGGEVYQRMVRPAVVDLRRVVAHYAITGLFEEHPDEARVYAYRVTRRDEVREAYAGTAVRIAHVRVSSDITGETKELMYAVLHFGRHDFSCAVRAYEDRATYEEMKGDLRSRYAHYSMADMVRAIDAYFPGPAFTLSHLFLEERRRVLARVTHAVIEQHEEAYRRIWDESRKLVHYLRQVDAPIPEALAIVARHVLEVEVSGHLTQTPELGSIPQSVFDLVTEARSLGLTLDLVPTRPAVREAVRNALARVRLQPTAERIAEAISLIGGAQRLGLRFGLWAAQNQFWGIWQSAPEHRVVLRPLGELLGFGLDGERDDGDRRDRR
jgi:alpha-amylase/alpha-mannosidase (GH57 family)